MKRALVLLGLVACGGPTQPQVVIPRDVPSVVASATTPPAATPTASAMVQPPTRDDPPDMGTPRDVIEHMIALLEGQRYEKLFQTYVDPDELRKLLEGKTLRDVIDTFVREDKPRDLMKILLDARTMQPVMDPEHHTAEYDTEEKTVHFHEVNGRWYIMND